MTLPPESENIFPQPLPTAQHRQRLGELAIVFTRLGAIAFGGPVAHIAMMDREVVEQRQWMTREKLLDLLSISNLLPGPNSTELAIHIGYERAGWLGLLVAGISFILPATAIVWMIAILYDRYQILPQMASFLAGVKPVIIAIIFQAIWNLRPKAAKDAPTIVAALFALGGYLLGYPEIAILLTLGLAVMLAKNWSQRGQVNSFLLVTIPSNFMPVGLATPVATVSTVTWIQVFLFFLKIGCVLYGSGYVLLAFLQQELVERQHWLTSQQLLDAIAVGQFTPGPVFTTATFVGYLLAGHAGAIAGTVGIFLPAFVLVWIVSPWVTKLRQSKWVNGFLDGVNAASWGLMAGMLLILGRAALFNWLTVGIAAVSLIIIFRFKINSAWLLLGGGLVGLITLLKM